MPSRARDSGKWYKQAPFMSVIWDNTCPTSSYDIQPDSSLVAENLSLVPLWIENIMVCRRINAISSHYRWDRPLRFQHLPLCRCSVIPIWILAITLWAVHQRCSLLGTFGSSQITLCIIALLSTAAIAIVFVLSLIHIWRCRRIERCRSRWSPYH